MAFNKAKALQEAEKSVSQGKISQAIKQYLHIVEKEPSDLSLLNTIGDLYVRDKNIAEGLKQFHKLAEAYVREGYTVKAIAIYKKITKLDPNTVDPLLKLADLYQIQGLGREAREQYSQAVEFYKKKNQNDKAVEICRKIVQLDPENPTYRVRLAAFCEQIGRKDEAAQVYLEAAQVALRRDDVAAAEPALKKALELDPKSPQAHLMQARVAMIHHQPQEAERVLVSVPELKDDPAARQLLLEAYLAAHKLEAAEKLVVDVYRASPADFAPLASFTAVCMEKGAIDAAFHSLSQVADGLIEQQSTGPLMECLHQIWTKSPRHIPTLELIHKICERTADEFTLPEILLALGRAYEEAGDLDKAERTYQKLCDREPENEHYKGLLKQILKKQGKQVVAPQVQDFAKGEVALMPEVEVAAGPAAPPAAEDVEQAAMVKEALENSDLFARYGLPQKAAAELEKVLALYPEQIDIHKRMIEVCRKNLPERAAQAATALAQIYAKRGDVASAKRYEQEARQQSAAAAIEEAALPSAALEVEAPVAPPATPEPVAKEIDLTAEFPLGPAEPAAPAEIAPVAPPEMEIAPPAGMTFDLTAPAPPEPVSAPASGAEAAEIDLSGDLEAMVAPRAEGLPGAAAPPEAPPFSYEESRVEIDFYLDNGFGDEARKAVEVLEEQFPGNPQVAELRRRVESRLGGPAAAGPAAPPVAQPEAVPVPPQPAAEPSVEWELPTSYAAPAEPLPPPPSAEGPPPPPPVEPPSPPPVPESLPAVAAPAAAPSGADMLGDLAGELASSLEGLAEAAPPVTPPPTAEGVPGALPSPLSGLLEEMGAPAAEAAARQDDPETHYNLGVAFREMGLLDEAIGEFQKVVKGAGKGAFPPNFLQACSLLAVCFMDKKMPAIAAKWYLRALEAPSLDQEATLALQYDLGVAYEQAGDARTALEKFTEVYSENIDYRDVAEKIRLLQQKVP